MLLFVGGLTAMAWVGFRLEGTLVKTVAVNDAAFHSVVLKELRTLYTSEVVERVQGQNIKASHDYQLNKGHIPLPVTFSLLLGKRLEQSLGSDVRLYSSYPFPWRKNGGPRDAFEQEALAYLTAHPDEDFVRFVERSGTMAVRYATADRMRPSCVNCHNTHADSPKRDWKVNDVRGVLSVTRPLQPNSAQAAARLRAILLMLFGTALVGLTVLGLAVMKLRRSAVAATGDAAAISRSHAELRSEVAHRHKAQEETAELKEQLNHSQRLESIGLLAGGIAHDFNNLLQGIVGQAELTRGLLPDDHEGRARLDRLIDGVVGARGLTGQLLTYAGRGVRERSPTDVHDVINGVAPLAETAAQTRTTIVYERGENLPLVNADPSQLQQVVLNLITNALDATRERDVPEVAVRTLVENIDSPQLRTMLLAQERKPGLYVTIEVQDNGIGMSGETRNRMFDPFFTSKRVGRGLGLAAVIGIINSHDGTLLVTSELDQGTIIRVSFPAMPAAVSVARCDDGPSATVDGKGKVAIVIDDDAQIRTTTADFLRLIGFDVAAAARGKDGLALLEQAGGDVALVVLDGQMPGLSGEETLRAIHARRPNLPVLFCSGFEISAMRERLAGRQHLRFLEKPYTLDSFHRGIAALEPYFTVSDSDDPHPGQ